VSFVWHIAQCWYYDLDLWRGNFNAMPNRNKWVRQIHCDDSVVTAARVTLKMRLAIVTHFLELAAHRADETPEHVHQLRVSTRRSLAALRMYEAVLPKKEAKWLRKRLSRIRKAAGEARDLDVFLQRYETQSGPDHARFMSRLRRRRRKAQRPIIKLHKKLISKHRFERRVERLLKMIACDSSPCEQPLGDWARSRIAEATEKFFKNAPQQAPPTLKELHRFRIQGKQLRYVIELFSAVLPSDVRTSLYPLVTELQDKLGKLCDHASACQQLAGWRQESSSGRGADHLLKLEKQEQQELQESITQFATWWTPELADELQTSLFAVAGRRPDGGGKDR
jgi:CHAD domain-containing protein